MLDKLDAIKAKFTDLGVALSNPAIVADNKKFGAMSKEYRSLEKIVVARDAYVKLLEDLEFNREVLNGDDEEMRSLAKLELPALEEKKESMEKNLLPIFQNNVVDIGAIITLSVLYVRLAPQQFFGGQELDWQAGEFTVAGVIEPALVHSTDVVH